MPLMMELDDDFDEDDDDDEDDEPMTTACGTHFLLTGDRCRLKAGWL